MTKKAAKAKRTRKARPTEKPPVPSGPVAAGSFPVAGIGAPGLDPLTELLLNLPEKAGMAYVLVQHFDPTHCRALQKILSRTTRIPVTEVTDSMTVRSGHIYVIPANTNILVTGGLLRLVPRDVTQDSEQLQRLRRLSARLMRAHDQERRRIARELHDSTGQSLAAMQMTLDEVAKRADGWSSKSKDGDAIRECMDLVNQASREIRTMAQLLHPPELDLAGLVSATRTLVREFSERSGILVEFEAPAELETLGDDIDLALFRVVQECLTNIHRHSGAKRAKIHLSQTPNTVMLEVSDDGRGLKANSSGRSEGQEHVLGLGILGMKERLLQLGGTLEISSKGKGTAVQALVPRRDALAAPRKFPW